MARAALVVVVPEAEPFVGRLRHRYDPVSSFGVPPHVTVLYPFRPVLDAHASSVVATICAQIDPFVCRFEQVSTFEVNGSGTGGVVWLVPEPDSPFRALTGALAAAFPEHPPYGGTVPDPTPHLTIADGVTAEVADEVRAAVAEVAFSSLVDRLTMIVEDDDGHWSHDVSWPLGRA